jgi:hypothetical protein
LEGLARWNQDRAAAMLQDGVSGPHSYSAELRHAMNQLGVRVLGKEFDSGFMPPRKYTGKIVVFIIIIVSLVTVQQIPKYFFA